jgi:hypothetical protein
MNNACKSSSPSSPALETPMESRKSGDDPHRHPVSPTVTPNDRGPAKLPGCPAGGTADLGAPGVEEDGELRHIVGQDQSLPGGDAPKDRTVQDWA